jgi:thiol-disulfide isomerase/thioredoxin
MKDIKTIEDFKEAITSNNESYFFFYSNGCESCREIKPQVRLFESKAQPQTAFYNISTYNKEELVESLKLEWVPTLIHLTQGKVRRIEGADKILDYINERPF